VNGLSVIALGDLAFGRPVRITATTSVGHGIEPLTGIPAGGRAADGAYPPDTVYRRVEDRFGQLAEAVREYLLLVDGSPDSTGRRKASARR
jgi:hypothetical protein